jgi:hypothetical protein
MFHLGAFHNDPFDDPFFTSGFGGGMPGLYNNDPFFNRAGPAMPSMGGFSGLMGPPMGSSMMSGYSSNIPSGFPSSSGTSTSFSFSSGGFGGSGGAQTTRQQTRIVNGVRTSVTEIEDGCGNKTVITEHPDGRKEVLVNGVRQIDDGGSSTRRASKCLCQHSPISVVPEIVLCLSFPFMFVSFDCFLCS